MHLLSEAALPGVQAQGVHGHRGLILPDRQSTSLTWASQKWDQAEGECSILRSGEYSAAPVKESAYMPELRRGVLAGRVFSWSPFGRACCGRLA